jgi:DNA-directed RNA polymerase subunit M/transcription elongation factor TFIIS
VILILDLEHSDVSFRAIMESLGPAGEFLRISDHYRALSDEEILDLAEQPSELTEIAQQALANEMSHRGLKARPQTPATRPEVWTPPDNLDLDDPYGEDRQLVRICTVWSLADASQVQRLLDTAGIPFLMGREKATGVDAVTSNFAEGVDVGVMSIGIPWARQAMQYYEPVDDRTPKEEKVVEGELSVRCPKCRSAEVVLQEMTPIDNAESSTQICKWTCDSCGHRWEDNGELKE